METLKEVLFNGVNKNISISTTDPVTVVRGKVKEVCSDHVVIEDGETTNYVSVNHIVKFFFYSVSK